MSDLYFSEREHGERPRDNETIDIRVWEGIQAKIATLVNNGSFGLNYPDCSCPEGSTDPVGTDKESFYGENPDLDSSGKSLPQTHAILDGIEFCWQNVSKPKVIRHHSFYDHSHLKFDVKAGRAGFCEQINTIFRRNSLAYELKPNGRVERLIAPELRESIYSRFHTGDTELDKMLEMAQKKFLDPRVDVRRETLQSLWDAWERLKTCCDPRGDKKKGITSLLNVVAGGLPKLRDMLDCLLE